MWHSLALLSLLSFAASPVASADCKCTPDSSCWPSTSDWASLNDTLGGALIRGVPPGSVCYRDQPNYDEALCNTALSQWTTSTFQAQDPIGIDYPIWVNNSCNPILPNGTSFDGDPNAGARGCTIGNYPVYAVSVTQPAQVSAALKWAAQKNIRVVIKNTGHNYPGRNTGYGSLSIWTHNLKGIEYIDDFKPTSCPYDGNLMAARIGAGEVGSDVQAEVSKYGAAVATGGNPDTGVVGWLTGGGHGFLTSEYGMGSDNLLEATIVTPDGALHTANPCQDSDLFFATRGGGGSTFGVIISAVVRAYPSPQVTRHAFNISLSDANASVEYYDLIGYLHSEMPRLNAGGMQGYTAIAGPPYYPTLGFQWNFTLFDKPNGTVEKLMEPINARLKNASAAIVPGSEITMFPTYYDFTTILPNEAIGSSVGAYGSHMLSTKSMADANRLAELFTQIGPNLDSEKPNGVFSNTLLLGHMCASPNPPSYYPEVESMTPSWRITNTHMIAIQNWPVGTDQAGVDSVYQDITYNRIQPLRELSPETGAYFNECDSFEPDWQTSFFGLNYPRLLAIKQKYDPKGLLWCSKCVGSEAFTESSNGKLCRST